MTAVCLHFESNNNLFAFFFSCKVHEHQTALASQGAVNALHLLLLSPLPDVQLPGKYIFFLHDIEKLLHPCRRNTVYNL